MDENLMNQIEENTDTGMRETDIPLEDIEQEISIEEATYDVVVEPEEDVVIDISESMGWVSGDSRYHDSLLGIDFPRQHPITAITNLREELDEIERLKVVHADKFNVANYYKWANDAAYDTHGYFVSVVDGDKIQICNGADVFGVVIRGGASPDAGFIGGQSVTPRDNTYGLIVTSGLVDVRCELDVDVGDFIVSNSSGYAKKSESNYGYRVLGTETKGGESYAIIALGVQADIINAIGADLNITKEQVEANYKNIISAVNVANQAYNKAVEAEVSNQTMSGQVSGALGVVGRLEGEMYDLGLQVSSSARVATQAKAIAESAATSATSMKNEAMEKANEALTETSELRKEFEKKAAEIDAELDNTTLELQATKEIINTTKNELQANIDNMSKELDQTKQDLTNTRNDLQGSIDGVSEDLDEVNQDLVTTKDELSKTIGDAQKKIDALEEDLVPLATWPNTESPTGIAGFVAQVNEDSATLASMVTWKGDAGDSLAGFVQTATAENAEIKALAEYTYTDKDGKEYKSVAALDAYADENKASINAIVGEGGSIAGLQAQIDENKSSVSALASWSNNLSIGGENLLPDTDFDGESKKYVVVKDGAEGGFRFTPTVQIESGIDYILSAKIRGTSDVVFYEINDGDNMSHSWIQKAELSDTEYKTFSIKFNVSIGKIFKQVYICTKWNQSIADEWFEIAPNSLQLEKGNIATDWKPSSKDVSQSIAGVKGVADANKASIDSITSWQSETDESLTKVKQRVDENSASITGLTSWKDSTSESISKIEQKSNTNESNIVSLVGWQNDAMQSIAKVEEKATSNETNITLLTTWKSDVEDDVESIASIKTQADANKSSIESLTSWQGAASESLASVKQQSDANKVSIDSITSWQSETEESIASVTQQADTNAASIESLTEWKETTSRSISSIEQRVGDTESSISSLTSWQDDAKTSIANVEQKSSTNESKIDSLTSWQSEASESIANVEQKAADNESDITSLTTWKDEATESITTIQQTTNQNSANISLIATWKSEVEDDVSSIASIKTAADENKVSIEELVKKDTELSTAIAGVKTTADANKASIDSITSWQDTVNPTINSVASIKQTAEGNAAKIEGLTSWQGDTNIAMARIEQKADANGAYIQSTVSNMDKYSVGPHSQAYGFTLEQAASVLEEGMIYVPTTSVTEAYAYVDENEVTQTYTRTFTPQYLYKWGKINNQYRWITVDKYYTETTETNTSSKAVYFTTTIPVISDNFGYWYTNGGSVSSGYEPYTLYKWKTYTTKADDGTDTTEGCWTPVATLAGNSQNRAVSQIRQDANSIEMRVTNVEGSAAISKQWIDDNSANIQDVVAWKGDNADSIATFMATAEDNFASTSQVAKIVDKDGNINAASIVTAVNEAGSSVVINADHIKFDGFVSFANKSDVDNVKENAVYDTQVEYALSSSATTFDAVTDWSISAPTWQVDKHMWQRTAITKGDGTIDYSDPTCIQGAKGADGTGVAIKGTAYIKDVVVDDAIINNEYVIYKDTQCTTQITNAEDGDAYLVDGYLFVYGGTDDKFTCTGKIQGPSGETPTISINAEGYWVINGVTSSIKAEGETPTVEINNDGYWVINGTVSTIKAEGLDAPKVISEEKQFHVWTSNTMAPDGESAVWSAVPKNYEKGKYLWARSVYTMDNGDSIKGDAYLDKTFTTISNWCKDNNETYIDGANIYAGSVTADKIEVNDLNAFEATIGGWSIDEKKIYKNSTALIANDNMLDASRVTPGGRSPVRLAIGSQKAQESAEVSVKMECSNGNVWGVVYLADYVDGEIFGVEIVSITSVASPEDVYDMFDISAVGDGNYEISANNINGPYTGVVDVVLNIAYYVENYLWAESKFRVLEDGTLYASVAKIEGDIIATSGTIGGLSITDGKLNITANDIEFKAGDFGGRNLIKGTGVPTTLSTNNGLTLVAFTLTKPAKKGKQYTFSADVDATFADGNAQKIRIKFANHVGVAQSDRRYGNYIDLDVINNRIVGTLSLSWPDSAKDLLVYCGVEDNLNGNAITFSNMKFEEGIIATDWTPAPEDQVLAEQDSSEMHWKMLPSGCYWWNDINGTNSQDTPLMRLDKDGLFIRGKVEATTGSIAGWMLNPTTLYNLGVGLTTNYSTNEEWVNSSLVTDGFTSSVRFFAGAELDDDDMPIPSTAKFQVLEDGSLYASAVNIEGNINVSSGSIGGFDIVDGKIAGRADSWLDTTEDRIIIEPSQIIFENNKGDSLSIENYGVMKHIYGPKDTDLYGNAHVYIGSISANLINDQGGPESYWWDIYFNLESGEFESYRQ